jgi:uncharacterized protein (DUF1501 family)
MIGAAIPPSITHRCSRRALLCAAALTPLALLARKAQSEPLAQQPPVLVCLFLRGAADGLSLVVPHAHGEYYAARRGIAIAPPGRSAGALDLDGEFGLHPRLEPLLEPFRARELSLIHAVGSPHPTRSHFEAQDYMELGALPPNTPLEGWLARYLALRPARPGALVRSLAFASRAPLALRGDRDTVVTSSLRHFRLAAPKVTRAALEQGFAQLYAEAPEGAANHAARHALEATRKLAELTRRYRPARGASYPRELWSLAEVANLIKADAGLEAAWIDVGGWDTHRGQGGAQQGDLASRLQSLGRALAAFRTDLGPLLDRVLVLVMSEFGRTLRENGTGGTDHGHGGVMMVMGGAVRGGRVLGRFPRLSPEALHEGRDLAVTSDFRSVLGEIAQHALGAPAALQLFPDFTPPAKALGLFG